MRGLLSKTEVGDEVKIDSRGGHNMYKFNERFFQKWTAQMAYILGFIYADGNITDSVSSRCQYTKIVSTDREILEKIKIGLASTHPIYSSPPKVNIHHNGEYLSRELFMLRIGSHKMFNDLMNLGVVPNKSKIVQFPKVPNKYLNHFIRGYFDGDGCIYAEYGIGKNQQRIMKRLRAIFTCGNRVYLEELQKSLAIVGGIENGNIYKQSRAFHLVYSTQASINLCDFIYKDKGSLFLDRKYKKFREYMKRRQKMIGSARL